MKEMFAYKVIREKNGKLYSGWICNFNAVTEYKIGKWTGRRRGCGPLGTFKRLKNAKEFIYECAPNSTIYKCYIKISKYKNFWYTMEKTNYCVNSDSSTLPRGTILADKVMLLNKTRHILNKK
jgi:hypothetical protein